MLTTFRPVSRRTIFVNCLVVFLFPRCLSVPITENSPKHFWVREQSRNIQAAGSDDKQEAFDLLRIGNSRRSDGFWVEHLTMKSSTGALIYKTTITFKFKDQAKKELEKLSKQASKIVRQTDETDEQGKVIGRRVLAQFEKRTDDDLKFSLFYTKDEVYYQIDSDSLDAILALEKYIVRTSK